MFRVNRRWVAQSRTMFWCTLAEPHNAQSAFVRRVGFWLGQARLELREGIMVNLNLAMPGRKLEPIQRHPTSSPKPIGQMGVYDIWGTFLGSFLYRNPTIIWGSSGP